MHDFDSESDLDLSGIVEDVDLITSVNEEGTLAISDENSDLSTDNFEETLLSENINLEDLTTNNSENLDAQEIDSENSDPELEINDIPELKDDENLDSDTVDKE